MSSGWLVVEDLIEQRSRLKKYRSAGSTLSDHQQAMLSALCEADQGSILRTMFAALLGNSLDD